MAHKSGLQRMCVLVVFLPPSLSVLNIKQVADDEYSLRRPVWVRGVRFFPSNSEKLVIGTGYGQVGMMTKTWGCSSEFIADSNL